MSEIDNATIRLTADTKDATSGFDAVTQAAGHLRTVLTRVAIPAAIASQVVNLIAQVDALASEFDQLAASSAVAGEAFRDSLASIVAGDMDEMAKRRMTVQKALAAELTKINKEEIAERAKDEESIVATRLLRMLAREVGFLESKEAIQAEFTRRETEARNAAGAAVNRIGILEDGRNQTRLEAASQEMRQLQIEIADDELRIKMQTADKVDALRKKAAGADSAITKQVYEDAAKLAEALGAKRLAMFADEQKKKKDAQDKAAKEDLDRFTKLAAAQADAIERTLRRINQEAASQSNLDQFVAMGNRIERLLGAIERQRPG